MLQHQVWTLVTNRFAERRAATGLTQADLSRDLDVPRSQISVWLRRPECMTLKAAARLLAAMEGELCVQVREQGQGATE